MDETTARRQAEADAEELSAALSRAEDNLEAALQRERSYADITESIIAQRDAAQARVAEAERLLGESRRHIRGGKLGYDDEREVARRIDAFLAPAPPAAPPEPPAGYKLVPPGEVQQWVEDHHAARVAEPPPLPPEVRRVVSLAKEWAKLVETRIMAEGDSEVEATLDRDDFDASLNDAELHLLDAVAALPSRKEEQGG